MLLKFPRPVRGEGQGEGVLNDYIGIRVIVPHPFTLTLVTDLVEGIRVKTPNGYF